VRLPDEDSIANQHQRNHEHKADCQAPMDIEAVQDWTMLDGSPESFRKSSRTGGDSHIISA